MLLQRVIQSIPESLRHMGLLFNILKKITIGFAFALNCAEKFHLKSSQIPTQKTVFF